MIHKNLVMLSRKNWSKPMDQYNVPYVQIELHKR